jgi:hypothetical protein
MQIIPSHKSIAKLFDENFRGGPVAKSGGKDVFTEDLNN